MPVDLMPMPVLTLRPYPAPCTEEALLARMVSNLEQTPRVPHSREPCRETVTSVENYSKSWAIRIHLSSPKELKPSLTMVLVALQAPACRETRLSVPILQNREPGFELLIV